MIEAQHMSPVQIVIDTNVLVAAFRSRKGASFSLLSRLHERSFKINLSNALLLEYEEELQIELKRQGHADPKSVDRFLNYLLAKSNRCSIDGSLPADGIHLGDRFIFDLAIASEARIIVTYNIRHFRGATAWGITAMQPGEFLRFLEDRP